RVATRDHCPTAGQPPAAAVGVLTMVGPLRHLVRVARMRYAPPLLLLWLAVLRPGVLPGVLVLAHRFPSLTSRAALLPPDTPANPTTVDGPRKRSGTPRLRSPGPGGEGVAQVPAATRSGSGTA